MTAEDIRKRALLYAKERSRGLARYDEFCFGDLELAYTAGAESQDRIAYERGYRKAVQYFYNEGFLIGGDVDDALTAEGFEKDFKPQTSEEGK